MSLKAEDLNAKGNNIQDKSQKHGVQSPCKMTPPVIGIDMASANALINEALSKFKNIEEIKSYPDDSKLLANPKGIIKSFLNQAEATDPVKFDAYRKLCVAHIKEFHDCQRGNSPTCLVCHEVFQHWNTLQRHLQTHVDFKPFSCEICSRTFYSQSKLKRHAVIHNDVKPYKCPVCDRRLGRTEHLKRHLLVHSDNKPYGCSGCAHTTKRLDGIRRHIKRKHGSGAEIISLISKRSQSLERFSNFSNGEEKDEETIDELMSQRNQVKSNELAEINLKENFTNECNELITGKNENFVSSVDHLGDSIESAECQQCDGQNTLENERETLLKRSNHDATLDLKLNPGAQKDKKFPDWEHLMLPSQIFHQSLSGAHLDKMNQNQSSTSNVDHHHAFNKSPTFHSQLNILYNDSTFPQNESNDPDQCPSSTFGMSTSTILSSSLSMASNARQTNIPSSLSPEVMISQYFQSHQRFGPHVWGFTTNPSYHNY